MELQIIEKESVVILNPFFPIRVVFTVHDKGAKRFENSIFDLKFDSPALLKKIIKIYGSATPEQVIYKQRR